MSIVIIIIIRGGSERVASEEEQGNIISRIFIPIHIFLKVFNTRTLPNLYKQ